MKNQTRPKLEIWNNRMLELRDYAISNKLNGIKTKASFSEYVGMSHPSNIISIEKGNGSFTIDQITTACKKFKIDYNWIFGATETMFLNSGITDPITRIKSAIWELEKQLSAKVKK